MLSRTNWMRSVSRTAAGDQVLMSSKSWRWAVTRQDFYLVGLDSGAKGLEHDNLRDQALIMQLEHPVTRLGVWDLQVEVCSLGIKLEAERL
jgi:hypothetical protein